MRAGTDFRAVFNLLIWALIAQRLGIAPKSILMARYRIKLKLGLTKEDDLDEYIGTLK
jgi:hypothetical protein